MLLNFVNLILVRAVKFFKYNLAESRFIWANALVQKVLTTYGIVFYVL
jgi:hypothetical protein